MDRFSPTGKVSIKLVHPLRGSTFPGRHRSEFWLNGSHPVHPRNFGFNKIFRTEYVPTSIPSCKPDWNFAFQVPAHFGGKSHNHLAYERRGATNGNESAVRRLITTHTFREKKKTTRPILSFKFILMSTLTCITEKELEREIKNKGGQYRRKNNMKIL